MASQQRTRAPRRSREEWAQLVAEFEETGRSASAFCRERALSYQSFLQWRKRLRSAEKAPAAAPQETAFVELASVGGEPGPSDRAEGWAIELAIGEHMVLRIKAG